MTCSSEFPSKILYPSLSWLTKHFMFSLPNLRMVCGKLTSRRHGRKLRNQEHLRMRTKEKKRVEKRLQTTHYQLLPHLHHHWVPHTCLPPPTACQDAPPHPGTFCTKFSHLYSLLENFLKMYNTQQKMMIAMRTLS